MTKMKMTKRENHKSQTTSKKTMNKKKQKTSVFSVYSVVNLAMSRH
ncbi:MAG: hypothetical protein QG657_4408 [Acidobacteriota bacterium]|nr:hypothetical protein [Acidobacteriota bacterium]